MGCGNVTTQREGISHPSVTTSVPDPKNNNWRVNLLYAGFDNSDCLMSFEQPIRMLKMSLCR